MYRILTMGVILTALESCFPLPSFAADTAGGVPGSAEAAAGRTASATRPIATAAGTASRSRLFPAPLGASSRPSSTPGTLTPARKKAMQAYLEGVALVQSKQDFAGALRFFLTALSLEVSSTTLFAAAQCRRAMNRPIEAVFTYAEALSKDKNMAAEDRLDAASAKDAKDYLNALLQQLVAVKVVLPDGAFADEMMVRGFPVIATTLYGQLDHPMLLAGVRSRWIPRDDAVFSNEFVFYVRPGMYDIELTLSDGRRFALEKRKLSGRRALIDFTREPLPAKIVVENIQPGTHLVVTAPDDTPLVDKEFEEREKTFEVGGLSGGEYKLTASRRGFADYDNLHLVTSGQEERVYLDLSPKRSNANLKTWMLWIGVGVVAVAAITTTAVVLANRDDSGPTTANGMVTFGLTNP